MKQIMYVFLATLLLGLTLTGCGDDNSGSAPSALSVTTASLVNGLINQNYTQTLVAANGSGGYTWSITQGSLPPGLALDSTTGIINGIPNTLGKSDFTVTVTDTAKQIATKQLSIEITTAPIPVLITTATLPGGKVGVNYNQTIATTGGSGSLTWSITQGSIPLGLALNATTGAISGTPTTIATSNFTVKVVDAANQTDTKDLSIVIAAAPVLPVITTTTLADGTVGQNYSQTLTATGGSGNLTWSKESGSLPDGLNLTTAGVISGSPNSAGTSTFTIKVTDTTNQTSTKQLSITVITAVVRTPVTIAGAWKTSNNNGVNGAITFVSDTSEFFLAINDGSHVAVQHGTYTYNTTTGVLTVTKSQNVNANSLTGVLEGTGIKRINKDASKSYFSVDNSDVYTLTKITPLQSTIIGSWSSSNMFVTFMDASHYVFISPLDTPIGGVTQPAGAEFGTYSITIGTTATNSVFYPIATLDTNGNAGWNKVPSSGITAVNVDGTKTPPEFSIPDPPPATTQATLKQIY